MMDPYCGLMSAKIAETVGSVEDEQLWNHRRDH